MIGSSLLADAAVSRVGSIGHTSSMILPAGRNTPHPMKPIETQSMPNTKHILDRAGVSRGRAGVHLRARLPAYLRAHGRG